MWHEYLFPTSVDEALEVLVAREGQARVVAGGTDLILDLREGRRQAETLVDITRIPDLNRITLDDGIITLGAAVTYRRVIGSPLLQTRAPVLVEACRTVGSPQIRNVGTLVGNLANASPAGDAIPPLWALGASVTLTSRRGGRRTLPLEEFFLGVRRTTLSPDEMLVSISFPAPQPNERSAFLKLGLRRTLAIAVANVAAVLGFDGDVVTHARIALGAVAPTVIRAREAEESLAGRPLTEKAIVRAGDLAAAAARPIDDIRGGAAYRREVVRVLTTRALRRLREGHAPSDRPRLAAESSTRHATHDTHYATGAPLAFTLNGRLATVCEAASKTLLQVLRDDLGLTGTKEGCTEGECGACTVLVDGRAVLSCLYPALKVHGQRVETVEGLMANGESHALQRAFVKAGAVQCGYCTPGMLMAARALLDENPHPGEAEIKQAISGNLCRCTGYYQIVQAIQSAAEEVSR